MSNIDFVEEAIVDAKPDVVMKTVLDELAGKTHWWTEMEQKVRGGPLAPGESLENKVVDAVLHGAPTTRFTYKVVKLVDSKLIDTDTLSGPYVGKGIWSFEPADGGKTRIKYAISGHTVGVFSLLPKSMGHKQHSKSTQNLFKQLNGFLRNKN
jgi:hypothetical protein